MTKKFISVIFIASNSFLAQAGNNNYTKAMDEKSRVHFPPILGVSPNFISTIDENRRFLYEYFARNGIVLTNSISDITSIDTFFKHEKKRIGPLKKQVLDGILAYCGELILNKVDGSWDMDIVTNHSEKSKRYFPVIVDSSGKRYEFAGYIEDDFMNFEDSNINSRLKSLLRNFSLPVKKATPDSWFPHPLDEEN